MNQKTQERFLQDWVQTFRKMKLLEAIKLDGKVNIYPKLAITTTITGMTLVAIKIPAQAVTFFEIDDAGNTFKSAQVVRGVGNNLLDRIEASLTSTQDNDYFRFYFSGIGILAIETGPYFNRPFPSNTFPAFQLFNSNCSLMGGYLMGDFTWGLGNIAGSQISYTSGISQVNFNNLSAGEYVLKIDGTGQYNNRQPIHEGKYAVRLSGAEFIPSQPQSVPEPSTPVGILIAGGIGWLMKKKRASCSKV